MNNSKYNFISFEQAITSQSVLIEGSMYDRLKRLAGDLFDPELAHLGLLYSESGRLALKSTYANYIEAACDNELPIIIFTPTWRCNAQRVERSLLKDRDVNRDGVQFLSELRSDPEFKDAVLFIGGLIGCCNDCYDSSQALTPEEAEVFHSTQIKQLATSEIDFLFASTLPATSEAIGIAKTMSKTSLPYILSFVVDKTGAVLDGTPLDRAIGLLDASAERAPLGYFVNCVHPDVALEGFKNLDREIISKRLIGFQGNTSRRDPRELDSLTELDTESPSDFAAASIRIREKFGVNALGGCCGSSPEHIRAIASILTKKF